MSRFFENTMFMIAAVVVLLTIALLAIIYWASYVACRKVDKAINDILATFRD